MESFAEDKMSSKNFSPSAWMSYSPEEEAAFNDYEDYLDLLEDQDDEEYLNELHKDQVGNN